MVNIPHLSTPHATVLTFLFATIVAGCSAGSGEGLDISGRPISEGGQQPLAPTLESIQANVFNPSCIVCHAGASAPQGLRLDSGNSFANLVGIPSSEVSSLFRVTPGDPGLSYLIQKLEGNASSGEQMPLGGPPIPAATIEFVRQWIIDGALPESPAPEALATIVAITPDHDSIVTTLPEQILASFNQDMDASTVNQMTFRLIRSGGDGQFTNGNEEMIVPASVGLSGTNPRLAIMDLAGVQSIGDRYQVTIAGLGANIVLDIKGQALDGEFSGVLPSGDGVEGGDFVAEFSVEGLQPTLASIQDKLFTPTCSTSGCHTGPAGPNLPGGQDLTSEQASFDSLVGVASVQVPSILRVAGGDPDNSYLIQKLEGLAAEGSRMPLGGPFLPQSDIDVIRAWVASVPPPQSANDSPVAVAAATPRNGVAPVMVAFDATGSTDSDGTIVAYAWGFGDGSNSAGASPMHTYTNVGTYTAVLTVTDDDGATASDSVNISVTASPNNAPIAAAAATPRAGTAPLSVTFDSTGSADTDGMITAFAWNFGDGARSTQANPTHTYNNVGSFTATLTVTDNDGATASASISISVTAAPNNAPTAAATASPRTGVSPLTVDFDSSGSTDSDGTISRYAWDFDDGARSTQRNPRHTYNNAGNYTAVLTVTDDRGATGTDSVDIEVTGPQGLQPTLQSIQANVFGPICSDCHSGPTSSDLPDGMNLSSAQASRNAIVGVPSLQERSIMRVAPGNADDSYLIQKLEGTAREGDRMPRGGPFLRQSDINVIRSWIDNGANQ